MFGVQRQKRKFFRGEIILLLLFIVGAVLLYQQKNLDYTALTHKAVANLLAAPSYQFAAQSTLLIEGEKKVFSVLQGEKADNNNKHLTGNILGTETDIYQIEDTVYRKDALDHSWHIVENDQATVSMLLTEIDPRQNFLWQSINNITYVGKEKKEGKLYHQINVYPVLENQWIEKYFTDITYQLFIADRNPHIYYCTISATSRENDQATLMIQLSFANYNQPITITAPVSKKL